jgi:hypothetical protein
MLLYICVSARWMSPKYIMVFSTAIPDFLSVLLIGYDKRGHFAHNIEWRYRPVKFSWSIQCVAFGGILSAPARLKQRPDYLSHH